MKHYNSSRILDDLAAGFIVFLFVLGFFLLILSDSGIIGYSGLGNESFDFLTPGLSVEDQVNNLDVGGVVSVDGLSVLKVEDDPLFDVEFSSIVKDKGYFIIEFGVGDYNSSLDVWIEFVDSYEKSDSFVTGSVVADSLQNSSNFGFENVTGDSGNENVTADETENIAENASIIEQNASENDSLIGTDLGLDSWKDFEWCWKTDLGEFECYNGSAGELLLRKASMIGKGDGTGNMVLKVGLQNQKIPHFKLHVGNNTETFEFKESPQTQTSFGFGTETIVYGAPGYGTGTWGSALEPENRTRKLDDRSIKFTFNASAGGIHNTSNKEHHVVGNYWFERNSTNYADPTIHNGTITGDITNTTGIVGYGYEGDGGTGNIVLSDSAESELTKALSIYRPWSVSLWFRTNDPNENQFVFYSCLGEGGGGVGEIPIELSSIHLETNRIRVGVTEKLDNVFDKNVRSADLTDTNWHHVVITNANMSEKGYLDGIEFTRADTMRNDIVNGTAIGGRQSGVNSIRGAIDEVIIFNRTLSSGEISEIYNQSLYGEPRTIENCSLLLDIDDAGWQVNRTYDSEVAHNTSNLEHHVVGNWWFEQNSSDASGLGNTGTVTGATNTTGIVGYAYEFDGVGDYITITDDDSLDGDAINESFAISFWVKRARKSGAFECTINEWSAGGVDGSYAIFFDGDDKIHFYIRKHDNSGNSDFASVTVPDANKWYHIVTVYDGTTSYIYLNGVEDNNEVYTAGVYNSAFDLKIGVRSSDNTLDFNGTIDEVLIFNRTLSSGEISEMYNLTNDRVNFEGYNTTFDDIEFAYDQHDIDWKVGCYDDLGIMWNSSEFLLELSARTTMSKPNIGAHAYLDPDYVVMQHRFERTNGTDFFDYTGINNGTRIGDVKWCPDDGDSQKWNCSGRVGKGIFLDNAGDYVEIADSNSLDIGTSDLTISAWIKMPTSGTDVILDKRDDAYASGGNGYNVLIDASGKLCAGIGDGSNYIGAATKVHDTNVVDNNWHLVTVVFDKSANVVGYVDGSSDGTSASIATVGDITTTGRMAIGSQAPDVGAGYYFDGTIDEVTIWNRSLSATEVLQLWNSSAEAYSTAYTIQDISASNNNTADLDNDTIKYIYDWYVNNESMAVLNMPFEAVNNGSESSFVKDYSDNENNGVVTNAIWNRTAGIDGFGAYEFSGVNGDTSITMNFIPEINKSRNYTFSVWINTELLPAEEIIFQNIKVLADRHTMQIHLGYVEFGWYDGSSWINISSDNTINANQWYHLVGVNNAGNPELWVNGINQSNKQRTPYAANEDAFVIGRRHDSTRHFNGTIDEVLIFNRSLSAEQIKELYNNRTQTIKSQETVKGQRWKAEVTANDGYGDSIAYNTSELFIDSVTLTIENLYPANKSIVNTNQINFTYNITYGDSIAGIMNCSLWLGYNTSNTAINSTDNVIEVEVNQTFNLTFAQNTTHTYYWKVGCYDKDQEQTNSSMWYVERTEKPIIQALSLNSSFDTNFTNENLTCWANATDIDQDNLTFHGFWYKDGIQQFFEWNKTTSVGDSYGIGLAVDSSDNIIVNGYTNTTGAGNHDMWILKYNSDGTELWNETIGGTSADKGYKITVDTEDNIIAAGHADSFGPGGSDLILFKYDPDGNYVWNVTEGGASSDFGYDVEVDSENNVIAAGLTNSYGSGDFDMWILKYDSNGNYLWNTTIGGSESENAYGVAIDSEDNILVAGFTKSFGGSDHDFFTVKYDSDGNQLWNDTKGGSSIDIGWDVGVDSSDNVVVTGYADSYGAGNSDMWTIKYDSNGNYLWNKTFGWSQNEVGSGVAIDSEDNIIVHGYGKPTGDPEEYYHFVTVKYNSDGDQLWNITTASQERVDIGKDIKLDSEENIIINGYISLWTAAANYYHYNIWLIKYYGYSLENQLQDNNLINVSTLDSSYTTKDDIWGCRVRAYDSVDYSSYNFTNNITIDNIILKVDNQAPSNDTTFNCESSIKFTYNVSDGSASSTIKNCSLLLGYNTANANHLNKTDTGIEQTINQTFNLTFTVNDTMVYWKVGCYDHDDDQTNSSLRNFLLSTYCPVTPPEEHLGSSSGPGERKSSKVTESIQTVFGNLYGIDYLVPGVTVLEITDPVLSVYKIELDVSKELENVEIEFKEGKTTYVEKPEGRVYRYISINKNNLPDSAVNRIIIYFKVQKGFGENINLMHYDADWEALATEGTDEIGGLEEYYDYYRAESNKLSLFAITSIKEKKSFVKFFQPDLIIGDVVKEKGLFGNVKGLLIYLRIPVFSVFGLVFILLFLFVRAKLKRKNNAKVKTTKRKIKRKVKRKPKRKVKRKRVKKR